MFSDLLYRLRSLWRRRAAEAELDEELAFHREREIAKLMRSGLPPDEARRRATLAIGGPAQIKEEVRDEWIWRWSSDLAQDARYAFRALRQSPTFAAVAVLSLALGIGANTAIFSILNAVVMKPLPVRDPGRLGHLFRQGDDSFTYPVWEKVRDRQDVFSSVLAYSEMTFDLSDGGEKKPVQGIYASGDYFRTLGVPAAIGRVLIPDDDRPGATPAAVLSYGFWQRAYGGDPHIGGRTVRLNGHLFQVAGVTPPSFFGLDVGDTFDVIVPLTSEALIDSDRPALNNRGMWWLTVMGRLKPGVSHPQAAARLRALSPAIFQAAMGNDYAPEHRQRFLADRLDLKPAAGLSQLRDRYGASLLLMMGIVGLVLLIACVNIANLLLARASGRRREIAIRLAVGAGRGRLVRQLLTESVVLSLGGAACGAVLARWGGPAIVALISAPGESRFLDLSPDLRVLAFTAGAAILTGILFGLAPALKATRGATSEALKQGARGLTERRGRWSLGRLLVVAQVALSLLLLVGAALFVATLRNLSHQDLGFRSDGVLLVEPDLRAGKYSAERQSLVAEELLVRLRAIPGVHSAARAAITPIERGSWQWDVNVAVAGGGRRNVHTYFNLVSPGYFETLRTHVLRGRDFAEADSKGSPRVAIVNETAARRLFPGLSPIGQTYYAGSFDGSRKESPVQVVGLVQDAKYRSLRDVPPATIYLPISQDPTPAPVVGAYELRYTGAPSGIAGAVKEAARATDPRIALQLRFLSAQIAAALIQERLVAILAAFFGLLALVLASAGLYGVVAYGAARRRNEMAIRLALGATRRGVLRLMLRDLAGLVVVGVPLGLGASLACARLVRSMLFGVTPGDPLTLAGASGVLLLVAGIAGYLPARRAARLDPVVTLREE